jgi:hypothetical protein
MRRLGTTLKLRGNTIYIFFTHQGKKFFQSTTVTVKDLKHFDIQAQQLTKKHEDYIKDNKNLLDKHQRIKLLINEAEAKGLNQVDYVKQTLEHEKIQNTSKIRQINIDSPLYESIYEVIMQDPSYTDADNRKTPFDYTAVLKLIKDYQLGKNVKLLLSNVNHDLIKSIFKYHSNPYQQYLSSKWSDSSDFSKTKMCKNGLGDKTLSNRWITFKKLLTIIDGTLGVKLNPNCFHYKQKQKSLGDPVVLSFNEFQKLINYPCLNAKQEQIIELTKISLGTGLNFEDIRKLKPHHFTVHAAGIEIKIRRNKTGAKCFIPISPEVHELCKKYNYSPNLFSNKVFNDNLRAIMTQIPEFDEIDWAYMEEENISTPTKRHQIITHSIFRKTYITYCADLGIQENWIRSRVGHGDGRMMKHYQNIRPRLLSPELRIELTKVIAES